MKQSIQTYRPNNYILNNAVFQKDGFIGKTKGKGFIIYMFLANTENRCGVVTTSINQIRNYFEFPSKDKNDIITILNTLIYHGIICSNKSITKKTKDDELIIITIQSAESYTYLSHEDFLLINILSYVSFTLYCLYKRYYNDNLGYSFPKYEDIISSTGFANSTIDKHNKLLSCLGLISIDNNGYKIVDNKPKRSNNMYYFNDEVRNKVLGLSTAVAKEYVKRFLSSKEDELSIAKEEYDKLICIERLIDINSSEVKSRSDTKAQIMKDKIIDIADYKTTSEIVNQDIGLAQYIGDIIGEEPDLPELKKAITKLQGSYSDKVIRRAFDENYETIRKSMNKKRFESTSYKVNYAFKIARDNINYINDKVQKEEIENEQNRINELKRKELSLSDYICFTFELTSLPYSVVEKYKIVLGGYDEILVKDKLFQMRKSILETISINNIISNDDKANSISDYFEQIKNAIIGDKELETYEEIELENMRRYM